MSVYDGCEAIGHSVFDDHMFVVSDPNLEVTQAAQYRKCPWEASFLARKNASQRRPDQSELSTTGDILLRCKNPLEVTWKEGGKLLRGPSRVSNGHL